MAAVAASVCVCTIQSLHRQEHRGDHDRGGPRPRVRPGIERRSGRTRLLAVPDRKGTTLVPLVARLVEPGAEVVTDGHDGYRGLPGVGLRWTRIPHPVGGLKRGGNRATPAADGAISRFKRWLVATYNKPPTDLARYLGKFCFRSEFRKDPETALWTLLGLPARG